MTDRTLVACSMCARGYPIPDMAYFSHDGKTIVCQECFPETELGRTFANADAEMAVRKFIWEDEGGSIHIEDPIDN